MVLDLGLLLKIAQFNAFHVTPVIIAEDSSGIPYISCLTLRCFAAQRSSSRRFLGVWAQRNSSRIAQRRTAILSTSRLPLGLPCSPFDWHGPNASMVAEFAYSAIRALQLIV